MKKEIESKEALPAEGLKNALLVIDVQNDFCPGGALAVSEGDSVVNVINAERDKFPLVVFTQDWHPENHKSFAANHTGKTPGEIILLDGVDQILWPVHCVQGSKGAEFHPELKMFPSDPIFQKGTLESVDSYSAFFDNAKRNSTGLSKFLKDNQVTSLTVAGLATDYCVLFSVLDALEEGFEVDVIAKACRGVNLSPGDSEAALEKMQSAGAKIRR